jgi:hypothetical protein
MSKLALNNLQAFYTYESRDGERPDAISYNYYNDSDYIWLIALANKVIDPYYDFAISESNVIKSLINQYGSIANAGSTILYFENNYATDPSDISVSNYENLTPKLKKYWAPVLGENYGIISYIRKKEDWSVATNKTIQLTLSTAITFKVNEKILQNGEIVATVVYSKGKALIVHHVTTVVAGSITGETSGVTATVSDINLISQTISDEEIIYWSAVTAYDEAIRINDKKKSISLLDNRFSGQAVKELKNLLKQ